MVGRGLDPRFVFCLEYVVWGALVRVFRVADDGIELGVRWGRWSGGSAATIRGGKGRTCG